MNPTKSLFFVIQTPHLSHSLGFTGASQESPHPRGKRTGLPDVPSPGRSMERDPPQSVAGPQQNFAADGFVVDVGHLFSKSPEKFQGGTRRNLQFLDIFGWFVDFLMFFTDFTTSCGLLN